MGAPPVFGKPPTNGGNVALGVPGPGVTLGVPGPGVTLGVPGPSVFVGVFVGSGVTLGVPGPGVGVFVGVFVGVLVGVLVGVAVGARQGELKMLLPSVVKELLSDMIRPSTVAPETRVTSDDAMRVPTNVVPAAMVAFRLICQNTLQACAVPAMTTEPLNVKSSLIWKTQTSVERPVSVSVPANIALPV